MPRLGGRPGAARLQQVGLFTLIFMLQADEEPVTAVRLSRMTGQSQGQIHHQVKKLLKLQLIKRESIGNPKGRGRAYKLIINYTPETRRLAKQISRAIVRSVGKPPTGNGNESVRSSTVAQAARCNPAS